MPIVILKIFKKQGSFRWLRRFCVCNQQVNDEDHSGGPDAKHLLATTQPVFFKFSSKVRTQGGCREGASVGSFCGMEAKQLAQFVYSSNCPLFFTVPLLLLGFERAQFRQFSYHLVCCCMSSVGNVASLHLTLQVCFNAIHLNVMMWCSQSGITRGENEEIMRPCDLGAIDPKIPLFRTLPRVWQSLKKNSTKRQ